MDEKFDTSAILSRATAKVVKARSKEEDAMELALAESLKESSSTSSEVVQPRSSKKNSLPVPKAMKRKFDAIEDEEIIIVEETANQGNIYNPDFI